MTDSIRATGRLGATKGECGAAFMRVEPPCVDGPECNGLVFASKREPGDFRPVLLFDGGGRDPA